MMLSIPATLFTFDAPANLYLAELSELQCNLAREFTMTDSARGLTILFRQDRCDRDPEGELLAIRYRGITQHGAIVNAVIFND